MAMNSLPWLLDQDLSAFTIAIAVFLLFSVGYYRWWSNSPMHGANRGPKIYPLVGNLPEYFVNRARRHEWATNIIRKQPTLTMRTRDPHIGTLYYTANPTNVEHVLKTKFDIYRKGSKFTSALRPLLGDGIFNIDGSLWKEQRKVASHEFTARSLQDLLVNALRNQTNSRLLPLLSKVARDGSTLDLQDVFMRFGFDNICLVGFGVDTGCLELSLPDVKFATAFDEATSLCLKRFLLPSFLAASSTKKLNAAVQVVDDFAMSVISKRRQELSVPHGKTGSDLLSRFIHLAKQDAELRTPKEIDSYVRDMLVNFLLAGRDTSSGTLAFFFWLLSSHPEVEAKIRLEVESIMAGRYSSKRDSATTAEAEMKAGNDPEFGNGQGEEAFDYNDVKQMQYLHAALTETLRLYPSVPNDPKTCSADDVWPDGTIVKKGEMVAFCPFVMGRMERLWGTDCLEFKPERWLKDGSFVQESPYKFTAFQAGPRTCLGKDMAMIQMKYVAAAIINSAFRVSVLAGQSDQYGMGLTLKLKDGLMCKVSQAPLQGADLITSV